MKPLLSDLIIGVDMDDTIEHLCPTWVEWLNREHNLSVNWLDIDDWDMTKFFPTLTKDQIYAPLHSPDFWLEVKPIEGAQHYLKLLIDEGFQIYIVTTTHYKLASDKFTNCLFRLFPFIDRHNVITTCKKQLIKCDVLIDDGTHNIVGDYVGLLMDAPHNRYFDCYNYSKVRRVFSWEEIYKILHKLVDN